MTNPSPMPLWMALAPVVLLVALLGADVVYFGEDSSYGSSKSPCCLPLCSQALWA